MDGHNNSISSENFTLSLNGSEDLKIEQCEPRLNVHVTENYACTHIHTGRGGGTGGERKARCVVRRRK